MGQVSREVGCCRAQGCLRRRCSPCQQGCCRARRLQPSKGCVVRTDAGQSRRHGNFDRQGLMRRDFKKPEVQPHERRDGTPESLREVSRLIYDNYFWNFAIIWRTSSTTESLRQGKQRLATDPASRCPHARRPGCEQERAHAAIRQSIYGTAALTARGPQNGARPACIHPGR